MLKKNFKSLLLATVALVALFAVLFVVKGQKVSEACEPTSCEQKKVTDQDFCELGLGPKCQKCHTEEYNCHTEEYNCHWVHGRRVCDHRTVCDHREVCESKCSYCDDHNKDNWVYKLTGGNWKSGLCPTFTPTPTPTVEPTPTPTIEPTPTVEPTPTAEEPTPTVEPEPSEEPSPTPTLEPEETPSPTPEATGTPEPSENASDDAGIGGPAEVPTCEDATPGTPTITSATAVGSNSVKLVWTKVIGANSYAIFYGPTSGNYLYGVPSTGDTDNFTINGLASGFFTLRAINGCQPGDPSAEVSTGGIGGTQILGASTMAGTGTFQENLLNIISFIGFGLITLGVKKLASKYVIIT